MAAPNVSGGLWAGGSWFSTDFLTQMDAIEAAQAAHPDTVLPGTDMRQIRYGLDKLLDINLNTTTSDGRSESNKP
jgi:hypothetical protein